MNTSLYKSLGFIQHRFEVSENTAAIHFPNVHSLQCLEPGSNSLLPFQTSHYLSLPRLNEQATRQIAGEGHGSRSPACKWISPKQWKVKLYKDLLLKSDNLIILLVAVVDHVLRMFFATSISMFNPTQVAVLAIFETQSWCYVHDTILADKIVQIVNTKYQETCKTAKPLLFILQNPGKWRLQSHNDIYTSTNTCVFATTTCWKVIFLRVRKSMTIAFTLCIGSPSQLPREAIAKGKAVTFLDVRHQTIICCTLSPYSPQPWLTIFSHPKITTLGPKSPGTSGCRRACTSTSVLVSCSSWSHTTGRG